jgi:hypothetical protein
VGKVVLTHNSQDKMVYLVEAELEMVTPLHLLVGQECMLEVVAAEAQAIVHLATVLQVEQEFLQVELVEQEQLIVPLVEVEEAVAY